MLRGMPAFHPQTSRPGCGSQHPCIRKVVAKGIPIPAEKEVMGKGLKLKGGTWGDQLKNVLELAYMVLARQDWLTDSKDWSFAQT